MLQVPFRDDVCIIVRTVLLSGDRLIIFTLGVAVIDGGSILCSPSAGSSCSIAGSMWSSFPLESTGVLFFLALLSLFLPRRDLERRLRRLFGCFSRGLSFAASFRSSSLFSLGVSTMYISCDEVAVQRPVGGGSCSSPASLCIPWMSSESKSSMSVKSSTVAIKHTVSLRCSRRREL